MHAEHYFFTRLRFCTLQLRIKLLGGATAPKLDGAENMAPSHDSQRSVTLAIVPTSVRDCAIPLGAFANVIVSHYSARIPGPQGVRKKIRSAPPVLLPRRGEVALPGPGYVCEFSCDTSAILPILAAEPLLVELWHHDKYTKDVLLGVATVDLAEVFSARPTVDGARTSHRQEQSVPFIAPAEGVVPATLAGSAAGGRHVAFLDVIIRIEMAPLPPPPPPPSSGRFRDGTMASGSAASCSGGRGGDGSSTTRSRGGALGASSSRSSAGRPPAAHPSAERLAQLAAWERKEKERFEKSLAQKEEERLKRLEREWAVHEQKRAALARRQQRAMEAATKELKNKLQDLLAQEGVLHATAEQLALKHAQLAEQAEVERVALLAAAEREATELRTQAESAKHQLAEEAKQSREMRLRAEEMSDKHARAESEASVWKEAHAAAAARALELESDKGKISAALASERARAATLTEAHKRAQRRQQAEKDTQSRAAAAAAAAAAELPNRLERIKREAEVPLVSIPIGTPSGAALATATGACFSGGCGQVSAAAAGMPDLTGEAAVVQRRLAEHAHELTQEAKELEEFRQLLASREQLKREADVSKQSATRAKARTAEVRAASTPERPRQDAGDETLERPAYNLRSMLEGLGSEESWWERYNANYVSPRHGGHAPPAGAALVAELE